MAHLLQKLLLIDEVTALLIRFATATLINRCLNWIIRSGCIFYIARCWLDRILITVKIGRKLDNFDSQLLHDRMQQ